MIDKQNTQALFHFLLCQLIVQCSQRSKHSEQEGTDSKLKDIGKELGFKMYTHISIKRGITERPSTIVQVLKNIKTKLFKHLFNYQMAPETNFYRIEEKKSIIYGIVDDVSIYLSWMPEGCQITASSLVVGIIEGVCACSDLKCVVSCRKLENEKDERISIQYLVEVDGQESMKWQKK